MRVAIIHHKKFIEHELGFGHPERPERLVATLELLRNIIDEKKIFLIEARSATEDDLVRVHTDEYVERVRRLSEIGGMIDLDTPAPKGSYERALMAAGGALLAGELVADGSYESSFALTRPPGHHAGMNYGGGFCFFNNVAVMINYLKEKKGFKKFLILDWDVHHGNGTQDIFYRDPSVLYFSIHQMPLYPGTGKMDEVGAGDGEGYNVNVPLSPGTSGESFLYIIRELLTPLTEEFKPEMICVSAGYDAYFKDPLASLRFTIATYRDATRLIKALAQRICQNKVSMVLEGGYHLEAISHGILATISELAGLGEVQEPSRPPEQRLDEHVKERVAFLKKLLSRYWACFR